MMCERSASDRWGCWVLGSKADKDVGDCWCGSVCDVCVGSSGEEMEVREKCRGKCILSPALEL